MLTAAIIVGAWSAVLWWDSPIVVGVRMRWTSAAIGYNGCMCSDCRAGILGVPDALWRRQIGMFGLVGNRQDVARNASIFAAALGAAALFTPLPLWILRLWPHRDPGVCHQCGYSLAGLPDEAPCPECGTPHSDPDSA